MADKFLTPDQAESVEDLVLVYKDQGSGHYAPGVQILGGSVTSPASEAVLGAVDDAAVTTDANGTISAKLRGLVKLIGDLKGYTDGIEGLLSTVDGHVDGLEALITATNAAIATLDGHVDGLEGFTDGLEALLGTTNTALSTIDGHVDGLETLITTLNGYTDGIEGLLTTLTGLTTVPTNATSSALEASRVVKNAAGTLYGLSGFNSKTSAQYIQLHDANALPGNGAAPVMVFQVPANAPFQLDYGNRGRAFANGIVVCNSSTLATKTIGSADIWVDAQYS